MALSMWSIFVCFMVKWIARGWQIRVKRKKVCVLLFEICCAFRYLYAPPLSSGCTCCSTAPHGAVAIKYSLLTQFLRLSGIRPVHIQNRHRCWKLKTSKIIPVDQRASGFRKHVPVIALLISVAAASRISSEACSLYQAVWGVQIRLGASFSGPWVKLVRGK